MLEKELAGASPEWPDRYSGLPDEAAQGEVSQQLTLIWRHTRQGNRRRHHSLPPAFPGRRGSGLPRVGA